ncbi:MAG: SDR family oxidoreductase [Planctomycetota bacterium]|jgi:short-subunit dehydrogenase
MKHTIFQNNVVVVTGASSGIGCQLALQLAGQGAWLSLAARNTTKLEEVAEQCRQQGGRATVVTTDISAQSQCQNLVEQTYKVFGRIDTLINNAGVSLSARFDEITDMALLRKVMDVNFFGSIFCTHYALPYLKKTQGRLVCISSLAGKFPSPLASIYSASKHAMAGFFDSLRIELTGSGVSVTTIYPGWVATGISSRSTKANGEPSNEISVHEKDAMEVETCARLIIQAAAYRRSEFVMTLMGKVGLWLKLILPRAIDRKCLREME